MHRTCKFPLGNITSQITYNLWNDLGIYRQTLMLCTYDHIYAKRSGTWINDRRIQHLLSIEFSCTDRTIEVSIHSFGSLNNNEAQTSSHNTECWHNQWADKEANRTLALQWSICKQTHVVKQSWRLQCCHMMLLCLFLSFRVIQVTSNKPRENKWPCGVRYCEEIVHCTEVFYAKKFRNSSWHNSPMSSVAKSNQEGPNVHSSRPSHCEEEMPSSHQDLSDCQCYVPWVSVLPDFTNINQDIKTNHTFETW